MAPGPPAAWASPGDLLGVKLWEQGRQVILIMLTSRTADLRKTTPELQVSVGKDFILSNVRNSKHYKIQAYYHLLSYINDHNRRKWIQQ